MLLWYVQWQGKGQRREPWSPTFHQSADSVWFFLQNSWEDWVYTLFLKKKVNKSRAPRCVLANYRPSFSSTVHASECISWCLNLYIPYLGVKLQRPQDHILSFVNSLICLRPLLTGLELTLISQRNFKSYLPPPHPVSPWLLVQWCNIDVWMYGWNNPGIEFHYLSKSLAKKCQCPFHFCATGNVQ